MQVSIRLTQEELNSAITDFVHSQGWDITGKKITIDIVSGRKGNPDYALIDLSEPEDVTISPVTQPTPEVTDDDPDDVGNTITTEEETVKEDDQINTIFN